MRNQINTPDREVGIADAFGCALVFVLLIVLMVTLGYLISAWKIGRMSQVNDVKHIDLYYPRTDCRRGANQPRIVEVGLMDVRAADNIRIEYDFERDGYKISMPTKHQWEADEPVDEKWVEVAFVPAWATAGKGDCECPTCTDE